MSSSWSAPDFLLLTAVVTAVYQLSFFVIAAGLKIDKVTDFAGTTNFVLLALLTLFLKGTYSQIQVVLTVLVVIWGSRLAGFLLFRILIWGEDRRFDEMRNNFFQFLGFWVFQAQWVWVVSLPVTIVNASSAASASLTPWELLGISLWALGFTIETVADFQKLMAKRRTTAPSSTAAMQTPWVYVGLWKWSRHPNYFGEILLWLGLFIASSPHLRGWEWVAVLSPLFTASILLFLSGVPLLEASADKKYGSRADYQQYKKRTSILVPLPPSFYGPLPKWIKTWALLDLPMYTTRDKKSS